MRGRLRGGQQGPSMSEQGYLLEALREIARRAADDTLGIQADRLVAIANQAHAAIKKAEAPAFKHSPNNPCRCSGPSWKPHDPNCALWATDAKAEAPTRERVR